MCIRDSGNDSISGGNDSDTIYGGYGNDSISGGNGSDIICGGMGNDSLSGDAGSDTYLFYKNFGNDSICDSAAAGTYENTIVLDSGTSLDSLYTVLTTGQHARLEMDGSDDSIDFTYLRIYETYRQFKFEVDGKTSRKGGNSDGDGSLFSCEVIQICVLAGGGIAYLARKDIFAL